MTSIQKLTGMLKTATDMTVSRRKQRYTLAPQINAGQWFRQTLPKPSDGSLCDARDLTMRFRLNITSTDPAACVDAPDVRAIFSKLRVLVGSNVVHDIVNYDLLACFETTSSVSANDNTFQLEAEGKVFSQARRQALGNSVEYTVKIGLKDSFICGNHLLPVSRMSDVHIELFLNTGNQCLYSATDASPTFNISEVELLLSYISSPSVQSYLNSNTSFHIKDYTHRFNNVSAALESNIRLSSAHTSLTSITTFLRAEANLSSADYSGKFTTMLDASEHELYNVLVNGHLLYEEPVDSNGTPEQWQICTHAHRQLLKSVYYDEQFAGTKHFISDSLQAARHFPKEFISGTRTSSHNQDIVQRIRLANVPLTPIRADSYLCSDVKVYLSGANGDLKVEY